MCISTTPAPASATTRAISGSAPSAEMSLTIAAPASSARRATSALVVSTEIGTRGPGRERLDHREHPAQLLVESGPGPSPGRLDSPPMSSRSAPASISATAVVDGRLGVGEAAAVGEAVGRRVDDPHHLRHRVVPGHDRPPRGFPPRHDCKAPPLRVLNQSREGLRRGGRGSPPGRVGSPDHCRSDSLNHGCSIISTICLAMFSVTCWKLVSVVWPISGTNWSVSVIGVGGRFFSDSFGGLCLYADPDGDGRC